MGGGSDGLVLKACMCVRDVRACVTWTSVFNLWISIPYCILVTFLQPCFLLVSAQRRGDQFTGGSETFFLLGPQRLFDTGGGATVPSDAGLLSQSRPQPGGRASRPSETLQSDLWVFFLSFPACATQTVKTAPKAQCDWRKESLHSRVGSRIFLFIK